MRWPFKLILCFLVFAGCYNSAFVETSKANETLTRMNNLQRGMSVQHVKALLGSPRKIADKKVYGRTYTVWYYVTQGVVFAQTNYYQINFTPLVFYNGKLFGWGKAFYLNMFRSKTRTLGTRGGKKDTIYYYKTKDGKPPSDQSIDEILEEIHEERSFQPLDFENNKEQKEAPEKEKSSTEKADDDLKKEQKKQQSYPEYDNEAPAFWE